MEITRIPARSIGAFQDIKVIWLPFYNILSIKIRERGNLKASEPMVIFPFSKSKKKVFSNHFPIKAGNKERKIMVIHLALYWR